MNKKKIIKKRGRKIKSKITSNTPDSTITHGVNLVIAPIPSTDGHLEESVNSLEKELREFIRTRARIAIVISNTTNDLRYINRVFNEMSGPEISEIPRPEIKSKSK